MNTKEIDIPQSKVTYNKTRRHWMAYGPGNDYKGCYLTREAAEEAALLNVKTSAAQEPKKKIHRNDTDFCATKQELLGRLWT